MNIHIEAKVLGNAAITKLGGIISHGLIIRLEIKKNTALVGLNALNVRPIPRANPHSAKSMPIVSVISKEITNAKKLVNKK